MRIPIRNDGRVYFSRWTLSGLELARLLCINLAGFAILIWGVFEVGSFIRDNLAASGGRSSSYLYVLALAFVAGSFVVAAATSGASRQFLLTNIWRSEIIAVQLGVLVVAVALVRDGNALVAASAHWARWLLSLLAAATATLLMYFD